MEDEKPWWHYALQGAGIGLGIVAIIWTAPVTVPILVSVGSKIGAGVKVLGEAALASASTIAKVSAAPISMACKGYIPYKPIRYPYNAGGGVWVKPMAAPGDIPGKTIIGGFKP